MVNNIDNAVMDVCAGLECKLSKIIIDKKFSVNDRKCFFFDFDYLEKISLFYLEKISLNYDSFFYYLNVFISLIYLHIDNAVLFLVNAIISLVNAVIDVQIWRLI